MNPTRRTGRSGLLAMLLVAMAVPAAARETAYLAAPGLGTVQAYLVNWLKGARAEVISTDGRGAGAVGTEGSNQVITLDVPISVQTVADEPSPCDGLYPDVRIDIQRIGVRPVNGTARRGQSAISQAGQVTVLSGCQSGQVLPWGGIGETGGLLVNHVDRTRFAPPDPMPVGSQWVGFSDFAYTYYSGSAADLVTVEPGQLRFRRTGAARPFELRPDGWLVLDLGNQVQRGYLRISEADAGGQEAWLAAPFVNGAPSVVASSPVVRPQTGADWGSARDAARHWLLSATEFLSRVVYVDLLRDGTGAWVQEVDGVVVFRSPIRAWRNLGAVLELETDRGNGAYRVRRWELIRRAGKDASLLESEIEYRPDGSQITVLLQRLNRYRDDGKP